MKTKDELREEVWQALQSAGVARFPGVVGRIPNFIGAEACAKQLAETAYWKAAKIVKINPDSPQRAIRQRALAEGKIIYMAVPRLRKKKPFIELDPKKHLGERLLTGLAAGLEAGGETAPVRSAGLYVVERFVWPVIDLRVDWHDAPIAELQKVFNEYFPQMNDYIQRAVDPTGAPGYK